jgi:hypothetical protein
MSVITKQLHCFILTSDCHISSSPFVLGFHSRLEKEKLMN